MLTCRRCDTGSRIAPHASSRSPGQEAPGKPVWRWRSRAAEDASRVRFVGLSAVRDAAFVAQAIAEALGVVDAAAGGLPRRARAACDGTPTLLVLDNFEQVLDAAPLVADLLTAVDALRVLATSRAPLRVRGEREYVVGPLALPVDLDATSPADLARSRGEPLRGAASGRAT
jgi:predicted ATPase